MYEVKDNEELFDVTEKYYKYAFREDENGHYTDGKTNYSERKKGAHLAYCRIRLGLAILSEIKENGYCELEAEV